jgi:hypothetical protein
MHMRVLDDEQFRNLGMAFLQSIVQRRDFMLVSLIHRCFLVDQALNSALLSFANGSEYVSGHVLSAVLSGLNVREAEA